MDSDDAPSYYNKRSWAARWQSKTPSLAGEATVPCRLTLAVAQYCVHKFWVGVVVVFNVIPDRKLDFGPQDSTSLLVERV
ncbi:hypothetical protein CEXT_276691 [Caerostris extrusa]|uniref:Uncharacterized protein n=1 Tax=Caerostris extrusa TaxID=172846 RepID=A0AAV4XCK3_CAEEX|nr:hypothetical protein CEXT_276691 [Caerostris extrusa]